MNTAGGTGATGDRQGVGAASGLLSITDVAAYLGVRPPSVRAWRRRGEFCPAVMLGRLPRWRRDDLDRWIASRVERRSGGGIG